MLVTVNLLVLVLVHELGLEQESVHLKVMVLVNVMGLVMVM